jgi:hypothetical protein
LALVAFAFGVIVGLVALVALLLVIGSGIAGEYSDRAIVTWAIASGGMFASFAVAIWIGAREARRRGIERAFIGQYVAVCLAVLLAAAATVTLANANVGGDGLAFLGDLLALAFLASLVACNLAIWRRLRAGLG